MKVIVALISIVVLVSVSGCNNGSSSSGSSGSGSSAKSSDSTPKEAVKYAEDYLQSIKKTNSGQDLFDLVSSSTDWTPSTNVRADLRLNYKIKYKVDSKEMEKIINKENNDCAKINKTNSTIASCQEKVRSKYYYAIMPEFFTITIKEFLAGEEVTPPSMTFEFVKKDSGWVVNK